MRLGLLADVHERVDLLSDCIAALRGRGVDSFVMLGDVLSDAERIDETIDLLATLSAHGVWGNHDFGLCDGPLPEAKARFSAKVIDYFATLRPWIDFEGCRFQHIDPHLDPTSLLDLWTPPESDPQRALRFSRTAHHRVVVGHVHRWSLITSQGAVSWNPRDPCRLDRSERYLITVGAVEDGCCGIYDNQRDEVTPIRVAGAGGS